MSLRRLDLELTALDHALQRDLVPDLGEEALRRGDFHLRLARIVELDDEGGLRAADDGAGQLALAVADQRLEEFGVLPLLVLDLPERALQDDIEAVLFGLARPVGLASHDDLDLETGLLRLALVDRGFSSGDVGDVHEDFPAGGHALENPQTQALLGRVDDHRIHEDALAFAGGFVGGVELTKDALLRGFTRREPALDAAVALPEFDHFQLAERHADGGIGEEAVPVGVRALGAVRAIQLQGDDPVGDRLALGVLLGELDANEREQRLLDRRIVAARLGLDQEDGRVAGSDTSTGGQAAVGFDGNLRSLRLHRIVRHDE